MRKGGSYYIYTVTHFTRMTVCFTNTVYRVLNVFCTVGVAVPMVDGYLVELCLLIRCDKVEPVLC